MSPCCCGRPSCSGPTSFSFWPWRWSPRRGCWDENAPVRCSASRGLRRSSVNIPRPVSASRSAITTTRVRPWARSCILPIFRSWIRCRLRFCCMPVYCLALWLVLPAEPSSQESGRRWLARESLSWPVIGLTCLLFMLIDVVIDPVALRGDRWFLGQIYGYPDPGVYFGVPRQLRRVVRGGLDCDDRIPAAGPEDMVVTRTSSHHPGQRAAVRMRALLRGPAV